MSLKDALQAALPAGGTGGQPSFQAALEAIAGAFGACTATLHRRKGERLELIASLGVPPDLMPATRSIPFGKGMAGLCAARREPVTACNLQTDCSGVARPAARETGAAGAVVVPILSPREELAGTLGIGKPEAHTYRAEELDLLRQCADVLAAALGGAPTPPGSRRT